VTDPSMGERLFAETPSQVVVSAVSGAEVLRRASAAGVTARVVGTTGGDRLVMATSSSDVALDLAVAEVVGRFARTLTDTFDRAVAH
jgi:hypothetical protein